MRLKNISEISDEDRSKLENIKKVVEDRYYDTKELFEGENQFLLTTEKTVRIIRPSLSTTMSSDR